MAEQIRTSKESKLGNTLDFVEESFTTFLTLPLVELSSESLPPIDQTRGAYYGRRFGAAASIAFQANIAYIIYSAL